MSAFVCSMGCCAGCQDCYGMSIGCHQEPCRCDQPCTCRYADEDTDPKWRDGCQRHDSRWDLRSQDIDPYEGEPGPVLDMPPCPECGAAGACGYDQDGRPMIHATPIEDGAT